MFNRISESLKSIEYHWDQPKTYLVLVPGLSFIIEQVQLRTLKLPLPHMAVTNEEKENSEKYITICQAHLRGSLTQLIANIGLSVLLGAYSPAIAITALALGALSFLELSYTSIIAYRAGTLCFLEDSQIISTVSGVRVMVPSHTYRHESVFKIF